MNIVDNIRTEADKQKIPIARLERDLGFNHGKIRRLENSEPSIEKVVRVADYLNVSVDQLCEFLESITVNRDRSIDLTFHTTKVLAERMGKLDDLN